MKRTLDATVQLEHAAHTLSRYRLRRLPVVPGRERVDLRAQVTVFVSTIGGPTFRETLRFLEAQDCLFTGPVVIRDVRPMDRAFQEMLDRCQTPTYVQVDEDMLLKPYAVRSLYEALCAASPETAIVCFPLWDSHLRQADQGVKIYRHAIVERYPYRAPRDEPTGCDIDQVRRLKADGYRVEAHQARDWLGRFDREDPNRFEVFGEHRIADFAEAFERYWNVMSRLGAGAAWPETTAQLLDVPRFLRRLGLDRRRTASDLWALLGTAVAFANPQLGEKDGGRIPALRELQPLVLGGPEEVTLLLDAPGKPPATTREVERLLWLFPTIRAARLLTAGDPLALSRAAGLVSHLTGRGIEVTLVGDARASLGPDPGVSRFEVVIDPAERERLAELAARVERAQALGATVSLRIPVGPDDLEGLVELCAAAVRACDDVRVEPRLPSEDATPTRLLAGDPAADAVFEQLARAFPKVRVAARVPAGGVAEPSCDSPFRGLAVDGAGDLSGCLAGVLRPRPEHGNIYRGDVTEVWFEGHMGRLRGELLGQSPQQAACAACPRNLAPS